jgi:hypothetical protein
MKNLFPDLSPYNCCAVFGGVFQSPGGCGSVSLSVCGVRDTSTLNVYIHRSYHAAISATAIMYTRSIITTSHWTSWNNSTHLQNAPHSVKTILDILKSPWTWFLACLLLTVAFCRLSSGGWFFGIDYPSVVFASSTLNDNLYTFIGMSCCYWRDSCFCILAQPSLLFLPQITTDNLTQFKITLCGTKTSSYEIFLICLLMTVALCQVSIWCGSALIIRRVRSRYLGLEWQCIHPQSTPCCFSVVEQLLLCSRSHDYYHWTTLNDSE